MTGEQLGGVLRTLLAFGAGFVPATFMDASTVSVITGAVVTLVVALWSWHTNKPAA